MKSHAIEDTATLRRRCDAYRLQIKQLQKQKAALVIALEDTYEWINGCMVNGVGFDETLVLDAITAALKAAKTVQS